jgi:hypothetical protein
MYVSEEEEERMESRRNAFMKPAVVAPAIRAETDVVRKARRL